MLSAKGDCILVTDAPNDGQTALAEENVIYTDLVLDGVLDAMQRLEMESGSVGLVGGDVLPVDTYQNLATRLANVKWTKAQHILVKLRSVKSPDEITLLRAASEVGSQALEAMMSAAEPNSTHGDVLQQVWLFWPLLVQHFIIVLWLQAEEAKTHRQYAVTFQLGDQANH